MKPDAPRDEAYWKDHDLTLWGAACGAIIAGLSGAILNWKVSPCKL